MKIIQLSLFSLLASICLQIVAMQENQPNAPQQSQAAIGLLLLRAKDALMVQAASQSKENAALAFLKVSPTINVNFQDGRGRTALHYAAEYNLINLAKALLEKGADSSITDADGNKPVDIAEFNENTQVEDLLS